MLKMRIQQGDWEEGTLGLKNMPTSFILSSRELVVMEVEEYDSDQQKIKNLLAACKALISEPLEVSDKGKLGGQTYAFRTTRERWEMAKAAIAAAEKE
jgi:hypothetical protein